ncbi:leucine-rich repeat-containing protein 47-like isoform X1 [Branchiostoma floridae x Branchiostoma japonicum]
MEANWEEVQVAHKENRRELVLSGAAVDQKITQNGVDPTIYQLHLLNFLEISRTCLSELSEDLGNLTGLNNLILHSNKLTHLPNSLGKLQQVKVFDVSQNELESLPDTVGKMAALRIFNVSCNQLKQLPGLGELEHLAHLDVSHNQLSHLPDDMYKSDSLLAELYAGSNNLTEISTDISVLPALKVLDMSENRITEVPTQLSGCGKLKDLNLKNNPLKDRRLDKMVKQCQAKAILDYVRQKAGGAKGKGKGKKGKHDKHGSGGDQVSDLAVQMDRVLQVTSTSQDSPDQIRVQVTAAALQVRPYLVCCILRNLDLDAPEDLRQFLAIQNQLHDTICGKRTQATIATHDLAAVSSPLIFDARAPAEISIHPLGRQKEMTSLSVLRVLRKEAEQQRRDKKRNQVSGIHKYLDLLNNMELYPCLVDNAGDVISFPPITNSQKTKLSYSTKAVLVEVSSSTDLAVCKTVMEELLKQTVEMGLCGSLTDTQADTQAEAQGDGRSGKVLVVEQVRVTGGDGQLRVLYPSRTDLQMDSSILTVLR